MNPEENPEPASELKQIRTYQGDIAHAIKGQDESLFSIQQAERAKQGMQEATPEEKTHNRNKIKAALLLLGSFVLVGAGVVGGWYSYIEFSKKSALPEPVVLANELIPARERIDINASSFDRSKLVNAVAKESQEADLPLGEVLHVNLIDKEKTEEAPQELTTTQKFLALLEVRAPGNLVRALSPTFMLGAIEKDKSIIPIAPVATSTASTTTPTSATTMVPEENSTSTPTLETSPEPETSESIFLIIKLESFENAFAGMLEWEDKLAEDLGPLFSTREASLNLSANTAWTDVTDRNKDSRVLYSADGQVILVYSFFDQETLIITDSQETLRTILNRLANELLSR